MALSAVGRREAKRVKMVEQLQAFVALHQRAPFYTEFTKSNSLPSYKAICSAFGGTKALFARAGIEMRPQGGHSSQVRVKGRPKKRLVHSVNGRLVIKHEERSTNTKKHIVGRDFKRHFRKAKDEYTVWEREAIERAKRLPEDKFLPPLRTMVE